MVIMQNVIHIYGASGSGTSTLGRKISEELDYKFMDTDDYFWLSIDPKYTIKRSTEERFVLMKKDISEYGDRILPGGDMYQNHMEFLEWAREYDTGSIDMRSKAKHDEWRKLLRCRLIVLNGADSLADNFQKVQSEIDSVIGRIIHRNDDVNK